MLNSLALDLRNNMKKKILIIHDYPHSEGGGVEVQAFLDAKHLVKRGHFVTIASTRQTSETWTGNFTSQRDGVIFAVIKSKEDLALLIKKSDVIHVRATFSLRNGMMNALGILTNNKRNYVISIHTNINHLHFGALIEKSQTEKQKLLSEFASYLSYHTQILLEYHNLLDGH